MRLLLLTVAAGALFAFAVHEQRLDAGALVDVRPYDAAGFLAHGDPPASEALLGTIVSRIAERPIAVRCAPTGMDGAAGMVRWTRSGASDETTVLPQVCSDLGHLVRGLSSRDEKCVLRLVGRCPGAVEQVAFALAVLAHEAYHLYGIYDEAQTECYGLQAISFVAVMLGAPHELGRALADYGWRNHYRAMPPDYRSEHCGNGGRFDLRPGDPDWPG